MGVMVLMMIVVVVVVEVGLVSGIMPCLQVFKGLGER